MLETGFRTNSFAEYSRLGLIYLNKDSTTTNYLDDSIEAFHIEYFCC
jgi:hypothetical protein